MSSDVAERRGVDQGHPRHSISGDVAKWSVQEQWQTGGGILGAQRQVTSQTGGGILNARHRVTWRSRG